MDMPRFAIIYIIFGDLLFFIRAKNFTFGGKTISQSVDVAPPRAP